MSLKENDLSKNFKGDGGALHRAVKLSDKKAEDIFTAMGISNGTFYALFKKNELEDSIKTAAAKAMGLTVDQIFGETLITDLDLSDVLKELKAAHEKIAQLEELLTAKRQAEKVDYLETRVAALMQALDSHPALATKKPGDSLFSVVNKIEEELAKQGHKTYMLKKTGSLHN